jgi:hypothetical protein
MRELETERESKRQNERARDRTREQETERDRTRPKKTPHCHLYRVGVKLSIGFQKRASWILYCTYIFIHTYIHTYNYCQYSTVSRILCLRASMSLSSRTGLVLVMLAGSVAAMTCDSRTTKEACTGAVDGTVLCVWDEKSRACVRGEERLGDGMVGTTAVVGEAPTVENATPGAGKDNEEIMEDLDSSFCSLPPDNTGRTGVSCSAYMPMFWYNDTSGACEPYVYGGCGKTQNLFELEEDCVAAAAEFCGGASANSTGASSGVSPESGASKNAGVAPAAAFVSAPPSASEANVKAVSGLAVVLGAVSFAMTMFPSC